MRLTIRLRLLLLICGLLFITGAASAFFLTSILRSTLITENNNRGIAVANDLARFSVEGIISEDVATLRENIINVLAQDYVKAAFVLNPDGLVLMHSDLNEVGRNFDDPLIRWALHSEHPAVGGEELSRDIATHTNPIAVPVMMSDLRLGTAVLVYSHLSVEHRTNELQLKIVFVMGVFLLVAMGAAFVQTKLLLRPLQALRDAAGAVSRGNLSVQAEGGNRGDEMAELITTFNSMVSSLKKLYTELAASQSELTKYNENLEDLVMKKTADLRDAQSELVETARVAGMAEIATMILHNIGNAINSLSVRGREMEARLEKQNCKRLLQAVEILEAQAPSLTDFVMVDPRGKVILPYLKLSISSLSGQLEEHLDTVQFFNRQVLHICEIISMQQTHAKLNIGGARLQVSLPRVVDEALVMQEYYLKHRQIVVEKHFSYDRSGYYDKNQLLQVLVNILKNSADAIARQAPDERRIDITLARREKTQMKEEAMIVIEIRDHGHGFDPEDKEKLFSFGYTTKASGRGFGLHYCANYLQSIGGSIRLESPGPGQGATCHIELPEQLQPPMPAKIEEEAVT